MLLQHELELRLTLTLIKKNKVKSYFYDDDDFPSHVDSCRRRQDNNALSIVQIKQKKTSEKHQIKQSHQAPASYFRNW